MKLFVYSFRDEDEKPFYERFSREMGVPYDMTHEAPSAKNTALAAGCQAVNIIYSPIGQAIIDGWAKIGIQMIVSRTIGTDHIDVAHAKARGIQVCHIWYSPDAVADYALMLSC